MPGTVTSMPYFAVPFTFDGMSTLGTDVRRIVKLSGFLRAGLVGTSSTAAAEASSPKVALRPDAAWVTFDFAAAHSAAGTPHLAAAAASSISLAAAPATRMPNSPVPRTDVDPPVTWSPNHSAIL